MKKPILLIALFALLAAEAFAQFAPYSLMGRVYFPGNTYEYHPRHTVNSGRGYRSLRLQTKSEVPIDDVGSMQLLHADLPGNPNIIEIVSVGNRQNAKQWKPGDKTTIEEYQKDNANISEFIIRTPGSGYYVEFYGVGTVGQFLVDQIVDNRKFGVIMPNSELRITSGGGLIWIERGAIGWDDDFMYANNLDQFMDYLTKYVDYDLIEKEGAKARFDRKTDEEKRQYCENMVLAIATGEGVWGGIWGAFPPYLMPLEFANVLAQFMAQANMAAYIGYLYGFYPKGGDAFNKQLKLDNYVLFAENTPGELTANTFWGMAATVRDEAVQRAALWLITKIAPRAVDFAVRSVPVAGTIWGVGKGAFDGFNDAKKMGTRAIAYYSQDESAFSFDSLAHRITRYNYNANAVIVPARIGKDEVRFIDASVFYGNLTLKSITLGSNLRQIEASAFENCKSLETVTLGRKITSVDNRAFYFCPSLTTVNIPSSIRKGDIKFGGTAIFTYAKLDHASKVRLRQLGYTGGGVGPGFFVTNNTGAAVAVIEVNDGKGWSPILTRNVRDGQTVEVNLAPGTYDLRVRTQAKYPGGDLFEKKGVVVRDDTTIAFTADELGDMTKADYQAFIQARCSFSNPAAVWRAMDTHVAADSLYRVWAESYPNISGRRYPYPRPANKTDEEIIQSQCRFASPPGVWDAVGKHGDPAALLKVWADSYYKDDGFLGGIVEPIRVIKDIIPSGDGGGTPELYTLDGVWGGKNGGLITIKDGRAVLTRVGSSAISQDAANKGYIKVGDDDMRGITKIGDLTWKGEARGISYRTAAPEVAIGTTWGDVVFTMSADGQSFDWTYTARDTRSSNSGTYTRRR